MLIWARGEEWQLEGSGVWVGKRIERWASGGEIKTKTHIAAHTSPEWVLWHWRTTVFRIRMNTKLAHIIIILPCFQCFMTSPWNTLFSHSGLITQIQCHCKSFLPHWTVGPHLQVCPICFLIQADKSYIELVVWQIQKKKKTTCTPLINVIYNIY